MKKMLITVGCFLLLCAGLIFFIRNNSGNLENAVDVQEKETPVSQQYVVKEYKGNVAVFESGKEMPFRTTTTAVNELPPADRELLFEGITASSQEELNLILEDYCS